MPAPPSQELIFVPVHETALNGHWALAVICFPGLVVQKQPAQPKPEQPQPEQPEPEQPLKAGPSAKAKAGAKVEPEAPAPASVANAATAAVEEGAPVGAAAGIEPPPSACAACGACGATAQRVGEGAGTGTGTCTGTGAGAGAGAGAGTGTGAGTVARTCTAGHALAHRLLSGTEVGEVGEIDEIGELRCDGCSAAFAPRAARFSCAACDFDLCLRCAGPQPAPTADGKTGAEGGGGGSGAGSSAGSAPEPRATGEPAALMRAPCLSMS